MMQDRYRDSAALKSPFNRIGTPEEMLTFVYFSLQILVSG
jgi:hypothetical protein